MANILYNLHTIIYLKWFEVVYNMKQDNLIAPPFTPSVQEKLMLWAGSMLITTLIAEFGFELLGTQVKLDMQ